MAGADGLEFECAGPALDNGEGQVTQRRRIADGNGVERGCITPQ